MPAKEIKELRQTGKLEEALTLARSELKAEPNNIWAKRNISWIYYDYLKLNGLPENLEIFISWLNEIKILELPADEKMLFENLTWQVGKMVFAILKTVPPDIQRIIRLLEAVETFQFPKHSEGYSFLLKAFHKALKDSDKYPAFAEWWNFQNFRPEDFEKEKMPNGKEVMALAEQAYIAYAKHLLPKQTQFGEIIFDKEKALTFLPILSGIVDNYPHFQYPAYFNAKLLLALGDKENMLSSLLPFAKKKRNDFWVWDILGEAFSNDPEKVFACYCKALSCKSSEEMLVNLRQKMAGILISRKLYNEAKTEIDLLIDARNTHGYKIPHGVQTWVSEESYKTAVSKISNFGFYQKYITTAESLLYSDTPEEMVIVEFVNSDRKIINFIASESKFGFFKYERFFREIKIGDTVKVRFQAGTNDGLYQVYTAVKVTDEVFRKQFIKEVEGEVRIMAGKPFGFLGDVFVHPSVIANNKLLNGLHVTANAIKSYNKEKKQWSWKVLNISS